MSDPVVGFDPAVVGGDRTGVVHLFAVGNDGLPWPQTFDAQAWAKEFSKHIKALPDIATDEATMIGWFANAIMVGYDRANSDHATRCSLTPMSDPSPIPQLLYPRKQGKSDWITFQQCVRMADRFAAICDYIIEKNHASQENPMPTTPATPTPTPIDFATCPCGALTFTLLEHRIVCPECGAGIDVPELDLIKLVNDANTDDSAPFPAHN